MKKKLLILFEYAIIFIVGGLIYMGLEMLWRGYTHWTMGIVAGIATVLIGLINEILPKDTPLLVQAPIASLIITELEYISGEILNVYLGLNIWDYSDMPFNVDGQVCLPASILWMFVGLIAVVIDDYIRAKFNIDGKVD